ncbi:hypothetical protein UFOVP780_39 [uncultured Caudovirales phage]|uniref:Uncharacterized protein n=1 Tax=uncultured Caudovirales phage TaxID=2100421 RepID=A0A6J5NXP5_9CAUD|nr:hypothetical protein UFOVP780_39 [uncultured Caudovirales phage]
MPEICIVDENYVKKYTNVNGAVDANRIYQAIYVAQDLHIEQYLGTDLWNKIKNDSANASITGVYLTLRNDYIRKALVWFVMVELLPSLYYRQDNGSLVKHTSEDSEVITQSELDRLIDDSRGKALHYTRKMVDYLCHNASLFPEYTSNTFPDTPPVKNVYSRSKMVFSTGNTPSSRSGYSSSCNRRWYGC